MKKKFEDFLTIEKNILEILKMDTLTLLGILLVSWICQWVLEKKRDDERAELEKQERTELEKQKVTRTTRA